MKTFEITKEQILELANESSFTKATLNKWFPQAFENELEIGKWYNHKEGECLAFVEKLTNDDFIGYGFEYSKKWKNTKGNWTNGYSGWTLATEEEVKTALIAEAKKRGFKDGVRLKCAKHPDTEPLTFSKITFDSIDALGNGCWNYIFYKGKWAEIISEPIELTLEQRIERIEEQLKIKKL